ncbi:MAG: hypothetical protein JWQ27_1337 [Ferruginibacter sp.]|nr:hypothetical protein [Ferruginibacter sp.]
MDADISPEERALLDASFEDNDASDESNLKAAQLDNTDADGELLNEKSSAEAGSGDDLDIPGAEDDDENEALGEEDEENNGYSQADTE